MSSIQRNAHRVLAALAERPRDDTNPYVPGKELAKATGLPPQDINDAVAILVERGSIRWLKEMGTAPYTFSVVELLSRGRDEYEQSEEVQSMRDRMRDRVTLQKPDGRTFPNIQASVQANRIMIPEGTLPLEEGDVVIRALPSGTTERYVVTDRGYSSKGIGDIGPHYQAKVTRESSVSESRRSTVTYNLHGNSRINIASRDSSINVINATPDELFASLRRTIEEGIADSAARDRPSVPG